jgi:hypothetical protein
VVVFEPVDDIIIGKRLRPHTGRVDALVPKRVYEILSVLLLGVAVEGHGEGRGFELGGEVSVAGLGVDEIYVLVQCQDGAACVVELGAPVGGAGLVGLGCEGGGVEAVLFAAKGAI